MTAWGGGFHQNYYSSSLCKWNYDCHLFIIIFFLLQMQLLFFCICGVAYMKNRKKSTQKEVILKKGVKAIKLMLYMHLHFAVFYCRSMFITIVCICYI